jgi:hypothetical protein
MCHGLGTAGLRRGKVQLADAREMSTKTRRALGEKRKQISQLQTSALEPGSSYPISPIVNGGN